MMLLTPHKPSSSSIRVVRSRRIPPQIRKFIAFLSARTVTGMHSLGSWPYEGFENRMSNVLLGVVTLFTKRYAEITVMRGACLQQALSWIAMIVPNGPYAAEI